jgi:spermidine synthase
MIDASDQSPVRMLFLATEVHSIIYKNSDKIYSPYIQLYQLDSLFNPNIRQALTLGGGAYIAPMNFLKRQPQAEMTVVEIDPTITQVARDYFNLKADSRLTIVHQDGRIYLNNNQKKYDAIYGDAFASFFSIPFQLTTKEAITKIYESLSQDGIFALNIISSLSGDKSAFFQAEYKTLAEIFPQIYVFPANYHAGDDLDEYQNIIVIATKNPGRLTKDELKNSATPDQKQLLEHLWQGDILVSPGLKALTDDFAPVDYYISKLL